MEEEYKMKMKNTFLLIGISLSAVINVFAETEVEKEVTKECGS